MTTDGRVTSGTMLAGYRVVSLAGRGGMGKVYRARDERLGRDVALKVLFGKAAADPAFRVRLVRESRLAASLDHPNVVPVYDAGEADGHVFIAMRFVDGIDLGAELRQGPMSLERALAVAAQVAAALDAGHEQGLVHGDVKPSNVLVDQRGHCYLTDFGLSRTADEPDQMAEGSLIGTVDYVAPELIRGDDVDYRADVYSLACMIYELLTGDPPFRRTTDVATLFAHLEDDPPAPHLLRPDLPVAVDAVLRRALAKDPAVRHASCVELVDETRQALGLGAPPRPPRRWRVVAAAAVAVLLTAAASMVGVWRPWESGQVPPSGALVRIDPNRDRVAARTPVPGYPSALVMTDLGVWMADFRSGALWRFEPVTGALQRISSPGEPRDLAADGTKVYVASDGPKLFSGNVSRHDAGTGVREDAVELLACALGSGDGVVWAAGCPYVQRLSTDVGPLRETVRILVPLPNPRRANSNRVQVRELAVGGGSVWVLGDALDRHLWRLNAQTSDIQDTIDLPFPPRSVAFGAGLVWITDPLKDAVVPVDPTANRALAPVRVGRGAAGVAVGAGAVWVANSLDGTVSRIDPGGRRVIGTVDVGGRPHELAVGHSEVWVTSHAR